MLTCKEITSLVTDYLEGRLTFGQRLSFRLHLALCPPCRTYVRQMKATVTLAGQLPAEPPSPETREAMRQAFRNWKKPG